MRYLFSILAALVLLVCVANARAEDKAVVVVGIAFEASKVEFLETLMTFNDMYAGAGCQVVFLIQGDPHVYPAAPNEQLQEALEEVMDEDAVNVFF